MKETTSEALDQALWLHQAPGGRSILQARPLAEGQELLLRIAAGSAEALETAAAATGQPPERIEEATRFYLQQVLFTDEADAYRVLALQRGASAETIRHHHRLLQRWLHPDRSADPWNEVYAARVNQAWTALRDGSRRAQYDASLPELPAPARARAAHWQVPESPPGPRDPARWLAYAAVAGCAVLVAALLLRSEEPRAWGDPQPKVQPVVARPAEPQVSLSTGAITPLPPAGETGRPPTTARPPAARRIPDPPPPAALAAAEAPRIRPPLASQEPMGEVLPPPLAAPAVSLSSDDDGAAPQFAPADIDRVAASPQRAVTLAVAVPATPTSTIAAATEYTPPGDPLLHMQQAEASLRKAVAYLAGPAGAPPPLWNDLQAAEDGADQHAGLRARLPAVRATRIELSGNHWVLGEDRARFGADYTALAGRAGVEHGRLSLELVRREELWLVADLRLEPVP